MSFNCGFCSGRGMIVDTRTASSWTRRRYRCVKCGERWSTAEVKLELRQGVSAKKHLDLMAQEAVKAKLREMLGESL